MATFKVPASRIRQLASDKLTSGDIRLADAPFVDVSGVLEPDVDTPRFRAVCGTLKASRSNGVFHMIMLDSESHPNAGTFLQRAGGAVVEIDHQTEGGLARPYVIAAQIIDKFAPKALMVKTEGEKAIFASLGTAYCLGILKSISTLSPMNATPYTWETMPPYQAIAETWLGYAIWCWACQLILYRSDCAQSGGA